jgi:7-carboxy-7-deazaguanine synthase
MSRLTAPAVEMFASVQGEGPWVGMPQLFLRLAGCDLDCLYCDTGHAHRAPAECIIHQADGSTDRLPNPLSVEDTVTALNGLLSCGPQIHSLAITGGEPLLHPRFISTLASEMSNCGLQIYLETAGHLPDALAEVIAHVHTIAGDIKLPSTMSKPVPVEQMRRFWQVARDAHCFVKIVVTDRVTVSEMRQICGELGAAIEGLDVVLQPVTATGPVEPPDFPLLWELAREADQWFRSVRIIPQCHLLMGAR